MATTLVAKTSFSAGELDPRLLGRHDLGAVADGARLLQNVFVQPTGGVTRRPGTLWVADLPTAKRLASLDALDGGELVAFAPFRLDIVRNGAVVASVTAPWSAAQLPQLAWARRDRGLLICHPDIEPQQLVRDSATAWHLQSWRYAVAATNVTFPASHQPYARIAAADIAVQAVAAGLPAASAIPAGSTVVLNFTAPVLEALHLGTFFRLHGQEVVLTNVQSATVAIGLVRQPLPDGQTTRQWDEQAFSAARGWPVALTFHQDRLVVGGARELPNMLFMSRSGLHFDFDTGTGLDDEAIVFRLGGERLQRIRAFVAGRHLQVFTTAGEWIVSGAPLTPSSVEVDLQTGIGALAERQVPAVDVDGATLFAGADGHSLREFLFTDTEQAYQAGDISLLSRHLMVDPVDQCFDQRRRLFLIVRADGALVAVTIDRNSNVNAWSRLSIDGAFRAVCPHGNEVYLLVERGTVTSLERFADGIWLDRAVSQSSAAAKVVWTGFGALEGRAVRLVADGVPAGSATVAGGTITLAAPARSLVAGLPYTHAVEALPVTPAPERGIGHDTPYRIVRLGLRVLDTGCLRVDAGNGARDLLPGDVPFTGDVSLRVLGWRRGLEAPPWRLEQDDPVPCTILAATLELKGDS